MLLSLTRLQPQQSAAECWNKTKNLNVKLDSNADMNSICKIRFCSFKSKFIGLFPECSNAGIEERLLDIEIISITILVRTEH